MKHGREEFSVTWQITQSGHSGSYAVCPTQLVDLDVQQNVFVTSCSEEKRIRIESSQTNVAAVAAD